VIEEKFTEIKNMSHSIVSDINRQAEMVVPPFENILFGYWGKTKEEQNKLLRNFKITRLQIDRRGGLWRLGRE
jgi:hypothetical protein